MSSVSHYACKWLSYGKRMRNILYMPYARIRNNFGHVQIVTRPLNKPQCTPLYVSVFGTSRHNALFSAYIYQRMQGYEHTLTR